MQAANLSATATVVETREIAESIHLIRFSTVGDPIDLEAGAHVVFAITGNDIKLTRSYSIVDDGKTDGLLTIAVKLEAQSRGGSKYMESLSVGNTIDIVGFGNSMRPSYGASKYILVAGGIGVTPLTGIARNLQKAGKNVEMIYCARSPQDAVFLDMFEDILGDNVTSYFDSKDSLLDIDAFVGSIEPGTILYMCGPLGLTNAIMAAWEKYDLPSHELRYETFANSGSKPVAPFRVIIEESGKALDVSEHQSLLEALLASGHEILNDCRKGECGLCKLKVVSTTAEIDHRDVFLSAQERASGHSICCCVSRLPDGEIHVSIDGIEHGRSS